MTDLDGASDGPGAAGTPRARGWRWWSSVAFAVVVALVPVAIAVWVLLLPDPEQGPLAAVLADPDLAVVVDDDGATITPADGVVDGTVVFYPGAGVPPEAYLPTWAPVVEQAAVRVVVPSMPLRLAVLDSDAATEVRATLARSAPDGAGAVDGSWWVGGHSLGGAMAASFLAGTPPGEWDGLVLWGAYPAGDGLADRDDLTVVSVTGSRDGLTTPTEVDERRDALPPTTTYRELDGVNHAQFGAYGDQRGDEEPTIDDGAARELVATATADALVGAAATAGAAAP